VRHPAANSETVKAQVTQGCHPGAIVGTPPDIKNEIQIFQEQTKKTTTMARRSFSASALLLVLALVVAAVADAASVSTRRSLAAAAATATSKHKSKSKSGPPGE
jgi:hypothetical protein